MKTCDCAERIGIKINSWKLFEELKAFFDEQVKQGIFEDVPVDTPHYVGYHFDGTPMEWYADKWYKCRCCGVLWEFEYPNFPAQGEVKKLLETDLKERKKLYGHQ